MKAKKKSATAKKPAKPAAKAASKPATKATGPAAKPAAKPAASKPPVPRTSGNGKTDPGKYTPSEIQGIGWKPFRYPPE